MASQGDVCLVFLKKRERESERESEREREREGERERLVSGFGKTSVYILFGVEGVKICGSRGLSIWGEKHFSASAGSQKMV